MSIFSNMVYDLTQYVKRFTGTAAPSTVPDRAGSLTFDTTAKKMYASYGTSSNSDWVEVGTNGTNETGATIKTKLEALTGTDRLSADAVKDGTTNKAYTATEQSKLSGIASGAIADHGAASGLADDDHIQYSIISSQAGVPSSTPARIGAINIDTDAEVLYFAKGNTSSADWKKSSYVNPQYAANCRLTLESGVPDSLNENDMKDTLYLTKYKGNNLDLYDGTDWNRSTLDEIYITNAGLAPNTIYDVFASNAAPAPVLEWNFTTNEGGTTSDSSGNGNYGTLSGVVYPSWNASGKHGGCYYLGEISISSLISKSNAVGVPVGATERTLSFWFKCNSGVYYNTILVSWGDPDTENGLFSVGITPNKVVLSTCINKYCFSWTPDNNWHHIVAVLPKNKTKISEVVMYYDNVQRDMTLLAGNDEALNTSNSNFRVGYTSGSDTYGLEAYIDSVKVYSVGLSESQVAELYVNNALADSNSLSLSLTAWNAPTSNAITSITAASPRVANCSVTPVTGSIITISGDAGEPSNNATWRVGTVVLNTSFELLYLDGTDSSTPSNAGTASTYTFFDENQTRAIALVTQDGVLVKAGDLTQRYVGTVKTWDTGQFMDSTYARLVYNEYNQLEKKCGTRESSSVTAPEGTMVVGGFDYCPCFLNGTFANPATMMASGKATTDAGVDLDVRPAINSHDNAGNTYSHFVMPESTTNWFSLSANFTSTVGYNFFNLVASSTNGETTFEKNSIDTVVKC